LPLTLNIRYDSLINCHQGLDVNDPKDLRYYHSLKSELRLMDFPVDPEWREVPVSRKQLVEDLKRTKEERDMWKQKAELIEAQLEKSGLDIEAAAKA
jgi:hypothetical protein